MIVLLIDKDYIIICKDKEWQYTKYDNDKIQNLDFLPLWHQQKR